MERRVLLAAAISSLFLVFYLQTVAKIPPPVPQSSQQQRVVDVNSAQESVESSAHTRHDALKKVMAQEGVVLIESPEVSLEIGKKSAAIRRVTMKRFSDTTTHQTLQFGNAWPVFSVNIGESAAPWNVSSVDEKRVIFDRLDGEGVSRRISYALRTDNPVVDIELEQEAGANPVKDNNISFTTTWFKGDKLDNKNNQLEAVIYSENNGKKSYKRILGDPLKSDRIVPRGTILSLSERHFCLSLKPDGGQLNVAVLASTMKDERAKISADALIEISDAQKQAKYSAALYLGPRDYFYLRKAGFSDAFHVGAIGQIGLILLMALSALARITGNYGVAIVLFSVTITCLMAPFTLMGFRSMKKMQDLKPNMDKIMAQHKNDPKRANKEVLALYKEHKVSPLGGCLPMLLQMPIFIAMFQAISHYIDLRGKAFLWIKDLSMPDQIMAFPFQVPIIGNQLNLLPIIMAAAMFFQTKMTQASSGVAQDNPTAKMMSGPMMPIIFCVMFYHFSAGLVLYWLSNTLTSLAFYKLSKA